MATALAVLTLAPILGSLAPAALAASLDEGLVLHVHAPEGKLVDGAGGTPTFMNAQTDGFSSGVVGDGSARLPHVLGFDGEDDFVATSRKMEAAPSESIALWFRTHQPGGKLVGFETTSAERSGDYDRTLAIADDGRVQFGAYRSGIGWLTLASTMPLTDGRWHHVVATNSQDLLTLRVDGELVAQRESDREPYAFAGYWRLGNGITAGLPGPISHAPYWGQIASVRVYSRVLTAEEATALGAERPGTDERALDDGLALRFDPARATRTSRAIPDLSPYASPGMMVSMANATSGAVGPGTRAQPYAFGFDGEDDMIATSRQSRGLDAYSISLWFRTSYAGGKLAGFETSDVARSGDYDRILYMTIDGRVSFGSYVSGAGVQSITSPPGQADGAWHHVLATKDVVHGQRLYLDGALVGQDETLKSYHFNGYWRFGAGSLGSWPGATSDTNFRGMMGELRIYERPLDAAQTQALYARGPDGLGPWERPAVDLVSDLLLHLDAGRAPLGTTFEDLSARGDDLTFLGGEPELIGAGTREEPRAIELDGIDDRMHSSVPRDAPDAFSYSVWLRADRPGKILGFETSQAERSGDYDRMLYLSDDGRLHFGTYVSGRGVLSTADANSIVDGAWHHVVATKGSQGGKVGMQLYVDGEPVGANPNKVRYDFKGYWRIGEGSLGSWPNAPDSTWLDGAIASMRIYERALLSEEVRALRELGPHGEAEAPAGTPGVIVPTPIVSAPTSAPSVPTLPATPTPASSPVPPTPAPTPTSSGGAVKGSPRGYAAQRAALVIDGETVSLASLRGCNPRAQVIIEPVGPDQVLRKHVGPLGYEPCVVDVTSLPPKLKAWIAETLDGKAPRRDLTLALVGLDGRVGRAATLEDALLTGVEMPALDAASRNGKRTTLTIEPDRIVPQGGATPSLPAAGKAGAVKASTASSFRVTLSGASQSLASSVSAPTFSVTFASPASEGRSATRAVVGTEVAPIRVTLPESRATEWLTWARATFAGSNTGDDERTLVIEYLAPDFKTVLWAVTYTGVGVYGGDVFLPAPPPIAGSKAVVQREFLLYAETMRLT